MAKESWTVAYDGWTEDWSRSSGAAFGFVSVGQRRFDAAHDDLLALRPRRAGACEVCRGALPRAFAYCFACGAPLSDAAVPAEPVQTAPNAGCPQARLRPFRLDAGAARPERVPLPQGSRYAFVVAGEPPQLFAIDRDSGWLHAFDRVRTGWTRLFGVGAAALPDRAWSAAASPAGLVLPAGDSLIVVDLASGPLPRAVVQPLGPDGACAGGGCVLTSEALAPVARGGALHLARRRMVRGAGWTFEAVPDAPPFAGDMEARAYSAPMATDTLVSWSGPEDCLFVRIGDDGLAGPPARRPWGDGFLPRLEQRPYVDPDGAVWQSGAEPGQGGRRTACFERVGTSGRAPRERVGSLVLTSGVLACSLLTARHKAWVEESPYNRKLPGRDAEFLVPVQALDEERAVVLTAPDQLADMMDRGAALLSQLRLLDGSALRDLAVPVTLRSLTQVAAFAYDGWLYAYDAGENECWRWRMLGA